MGELVAEPTFIGAFCAKAYDSLQLELEKKDACGNRVHLDVCSLLEEWTVVAEVPAAEELAGRSEGRVVDTEAALVDSEGERKSKAKGQAEAKGNANTNKKAGCEQEATTSVNREAATDAIAVLPVAPAVKTAGGVATAEIAANEEPNSA